MSERQDSRLAKRRSFLKLAGLGTVVGGVALVAKGAGEAMAAEAKPDKTTGYRETDHVKAFYTSARF